jgi:hypothetical protein
MNNKRKKKKESLRSLLKCRSLGHGSDFQTEQLPVQIQEHRGSLDGNSGENCGIVGWS